jgi:hypothetical protein
MVGQIIMKYPDFGVFSFYGDIANLISPSIILISPFGQGCWLHLLLHVVCNRVQPRKHVMEIMDMLDKYAPIPCTIWKYQYHI